MVEGEDPGRSAGPVVSGGREQLALALDVPTLDEATRLGEELAPYFAVAKVGLELYSAAGPAALETLAGLGYDVFVDLKLHDIPTTVRRAAAVLGGLGARYVTLHTAGGLEMLRAGAEGLAEGAAAAGRPAPCALGVTVLTSEVGPDGALLAERAALAAGAGLGGLVCAATDLAICRRSAPGLRTVVPGTRPAGAAADDQARVTSPLEALRAGADLLVMGRPVTRAPDPAAAAAALVASLTGP